MKDMNCVTCFIGTNIMKRINLLMHAKIGKLPQPQLNRKKTEIYIEKG